MNLRGRRGVSPRKLVSGADAERQRSEDGVMARALRIEYPSPFPPRHAVPPVGHGQGWRTNQYERFEQRRRLDLEAKGEAELAAGFSELEGKAKKLPPAKRKGRKK